MKGYNFMGVAAYFIILGCMIMGEHEVKIAGYPKVEIKLPFTASRQFEAVIGLRDSISCQDSIFGLQDGYQLFRMTIASRV